MVVIEDKVYVHGRQLPLTDLTSWSDLSLPPEVKHFTLTTYKSQLVLMGGNEFQIAVL